MASKATKKNQTKAGTSTGVEKQNETEAGTSTGVKKGMNTAEHKVIDDCKKYICKNLQGSRREKFLDLLVRKEKLTDKPASSVTIDKWFTTVFDQIKDNCSMAELIQFLRETHNNHIIQKLEWYQTKNAMPAKYLKSLQNGVSLSWKLVLVLLAFSVGYVILIIKWEGKYLFSWDYISSILVDVKGFLVSSWISYGLKEFGYNRWNVYKRWIWSKFGWPVEDFDEEEDFDGEEEEKGKNEIP